MKPKILVMPNKKWESYANAIEESGGIAVKDFNISDLSSFDGLLLCGGNDVHPSYYGEEVNGAIGFDLPRDKIEFEVAKYFIHTCKPILGVCRGLQLLNAALGGTLIQDLGNKEEHRRGKGIDIIHKVKATGIFNELYGEEFFVNSYHHQAIKDIGIGLIPSLYCGNVIEGFESENGLITGVQFHPERMCLGNRRLDTVDGIKIFKHFINICKNKSV